MKKKKNLALKTKYKKPWKIVENRGKSWKPIKNRGKLWKTWKSIFFYFCEFFLVDFTCIFNQDF